MTADAVPTDSLRALVERAPIIRAGVVRTARPAVADRSRLDDPEVHLAIAAAMLAADRLAWRASVAQRVATA